MIECGSLEYAQVRVQARHGQRADDATWRRVELVRDFDAMLEAARSTVLRPWLAGLTAASGAHDVERALRGHWRALVDEVASWAAPEWRAALRWCAPVPDLPILQHLAEGGETLAWMRDDAVLVPLHDAEPAARANVLAAGPLAALARDWGEPRSVYRAWGAEWTARAPGGAARPNGPLHPLARTLQAHLAAFADAPAGDGAPLRRALSARLALAFRRSVLDPAAPFVYLVACALDLERLRGELLRRVAFPRLVFA